MSRRLGQQMYQRQTILGSKGLLSRREKGSHPPPPFSPPQDRHPLGGQARRLKCTVHAQKREARPEKTEALPDRACAFYYKRASPLLFVLPCWCFSRARVSCPSKRRQPMLGRPVPFRSGKLASSWFNESHLGTGRGGREGCYPFSIPIPTMVHRQGRGSPRTKIAILHTTAPGYVVSYIQCAHPRVPSGLGPASTYTSDRRGTWRP